MSSTGAELESDAHPPKGLVFAALGPRAGAPPLPLFWGLWGIGIKPFFLADSYFFSKVL